MQDTRTDWLRFDRLQRQICGSTFQAAFILTEYLADLHGSCQRGQDDLPGLESNLGSPCFSLSRPDIQTAMT